MSLSEQAYRWVKRSVEWVVASPRGSPLLRRSWRGTWTRSSLVPSVTTRSPAMLKCMEALSKSWNGTVHVMAAFEFGCWHACADFHPQGKNQKYWNNILHRLPGGIPDTYHMYPCFKMWTIIPDYNSVCDEVITTYLYRTYLSEKKNCTPLSQNFMFSLYVILSYEITLICFFMWKPKNYEINDPGLNHGTFDNQNWLWKILFTW